jgi:hypothetical protein
MEFKRRMPKMEKIPLLNPPDDIEEWYKSEPFSDQKITEFKLRDFMFIENDIQQFITKTMFEIVKDKERERKYIEGKKSINKETDVHKLLDLLNDEDYFDLNADIITRLDKLDANIYKHFLEKLKTEFSNQDFDNIIKILVINLRRKNISDEIIEVLEANYIRNPRDFASLLQILGLQKTEKNLTLLYTYYKFFKNNIPEEIYYEGPLLGIYYYFNSPKAPM